MRNILIIAATLTATLATGVNAMTTMHHKRHMMTGSSATRALNEKSLAQTGGSMPMRGSMSNTGMAAPAAPMTPDAAPMGSPAMTPTAPQPDTMTPAPTAPQ